jgi:hypothetical protein
MNVEGQIVNTIIPLMISVLGMLPFLFFPSIRNNDEDIEKNVYYAIFGYLLFLGFVVIGLITLQAILATRSQNNQASLFICALLLVACIDNIIDLFPGMIFVKANLLKRLLYFVLILCVIPIVWQIFGTLVPMSISSNTKLMTATEILLMISMFSLGIVNYPARKG